MSLISKHTHSEVYFTKFSNKILIFSIYWSLSGTLKKVKSLRVIDSKVAQNLSILLGGPLKHLKYGDVKRSILRCDTSILSANILEQLILYLPPPDQLKRLEQFKSDYNDLTEAEQFAVTVCKFYRQLQSLRVRCLHSHALVFVSCRYPKLKDCYLDWNLLVLSKDFPKWYKILNRYVSITLRYNLRDFKLQHRMIHRPVMRWWYETTIGIIMTYFICLGYRYRSRSLPGSQAK